MALIAPNFSTFPRRPTGNTNMLSYDLSNHDLLEREVKRLPLQAQLLFPLEAAFLKRHGVSDSCSLWDIGCGDGYGCTFSALRFQIRQLRGWIAHQRFLPVRGSRIREHASY